MADEFSVRRQKGAKRTASLGAVLGQGGDQHHSSDSSLSGILGQGGGKKKGSNAGSGLGHLLGQGGK